MTASTAGTPGSDDHTVYLGLGSNLGDRDEHLRTALRALSQAVRLERLSSVYDTAPLLVTEQPRFHNLVAQGLTGLRPEELLRFVKAVEADVGRTPTVRYGPRVIDIDILLYDQLVYQSDVVTVPHPGIADRAFVLQPLAEIAPRLRHPVLESEIETLVLQVPPSDVRKLDILLSLPG